MNTKRLVRGFIFVSMLLMVFATASFADVVEEQVEETDVIVVEAEVTVTLDETYTFLVDQNGTVISVVQEGLEPVTETVITFDEEGNMVVEEVEVDPYADMAGMTIVDGISVFTDPNDETMEYDIVVVTNPESEEVNAYLTALITGEDPVEELGGHPNALRFAMAEELGITPGKMHLLEKLAVASDDEELDYSHWADMPVKDIMAEIKANKKDTEEVTPDEDELEETLDNENETEDHETEDQEETEDKKESKEDKNDKKKDKPSKSKSGKGKKK